MYYQVIAPQTSVQTLIAKTCTLRKNSQLMRLATGKGIQTLAIICPRPLHYNLLKEHFLLRKYGRGSKRRPTVNTNSTLMRFSQKSNLTLYLIKLTKSWRLKSKRRSRKLECKLSLHLDAQRS